ncbi:MAG TPA: hypothetical protein PKV67_02930 [Hyphomonas sp.]|nr:hypothetical protein [Hyphomonas sp.]HRI99701.1 hypothetical protein [Hyphomonas sp.]HRK68013.1 hypothetical protein [Hyphomonas sp.]
MKMRLMLAAGAAAIVAAACASSEPAGQYANPVDACANEPTQEERDQCMKNVVADVALSVKRESERKKR